MSMDIVNKVVDEVLRLLREQKDAAANANLNGSFSVDGNAFSTGKHMVVGPFKFGTTFSSAPDITFGQMPEPNRSELRVGTRGSGYVPVLFQAYVYSWTTSSGSFDGFNAGLYLITNPVSLSGSHKVSWHAAGKASRYRGEGVRESWTGAANPSYPSFLVDGTP